MKNVNWAKCSSDDIKMYQNNILNLLNCIHIPLDCVQRRVNCCDVNHKNSIENLYHDIVDCLKEASGPLCNVSNKHYNCVPGWNEYVKDSHDMAREEFLLWQSNDLYKIVIQIRTKKMSLGR